MSVRELALRFETLFAAYVERPHEEHLARIAALGEELVQSQVPPEDIAEIFEEALLQLAKHTPQITLQESADRISIPLVEMLIAYGLAFRQQLSRQRIYEETKLAAKVIENAHEGIWVANNQGEILVANPALLRITGYCTEEVIKGGLPLLCGKANSTITKRIWTDVLETGCWRGELTAQRQGGEIFPALLTISSIQGDDGNIANYVGMLHDASEQKRNEESRALELARAKQIYDLVIQPQLQVIDGARINVECLPAENIGGDILLMERVDQKRFLVFLADVTGHGVPAAMTANSIKMLVKEISRTSMDPSAVCSRLNQAFCGNLLPDDLIVSFCGLFDLESMTLTYYLSGLPPPLILRAGEGIHLKPTGPPLGVFDCIIEDSTTVSLMAGDLFLVFTDGITEARDANGFIFGNSGVQTAVTGKGSNAYAIVRELLKDVARFQQSSFFADDVILLAIEIQGDKAVPLGSTPGSWSRFSTDAKSIFLTRTQDIHVDSAVEMVIESIADKCSLAPWEFGKIKVALFELLSNAIEHGNLEMTAFKRAPDLYDTEEYQKVFQERLQAAEYGERQVNIECLFSGAEVLISLEDEGNGFNIKAVADPTRKENLENFTGRGICIAEMAVDKIAYNPKGNRVTITKKSNG